MLSQLNSHASHFGWCFYLTISIHKINAFDSPLKEDDFNFTERLDVYDGDDDVSDPDDADYWYADSIKVDVNQSGRDLYVIPEMDERKVEPIPTNKIVNCNNALPSLSLRQDDFDVKLFQLMALVMLPGELDSCTSNMQRKGSRKMLQREWENADEQFEVVPQLHRDDETTLSELFPVIELN